MATDVEICNMALTYLGVDNITALNEGTKQANLCNLKYQPTKKRLLRQHPWNFALLRDTISDNGNTPDHEYLYEFDMPNDCLRVLNTYDYYDEMGFRIESNKILANTDELKIRYIVDADEADFPDDFSDILALTLAVDLSYFLVQSEPVREGVRKLLAERLRDCRSIDAQEGTPEDPNADEFLKSRW